MCLSITYLFHDLSERIGVQIRYGPSPCLDEVDVLARSIAVRNDGNENLLLGCPAKYNLGGEASADQRREGAASESDPRARCSFRKIGRRPRRFAAGRPALPRHMRRVCRSFRASQARRDLAGQSCGAAPWRWWVQFSARAILSLASLRLWWLKPRKDICEKSSYHPTCSKRSYKRRQIAG